MQQIILEYCESSEDYGFIGLYAKDIFNAEHQRGIITTENGYVLYTVGDTKSLMAYIGSETNLILPDGITEINMYAFRNYISLKSITIPNSVTTIGEFAFYDCHKLDRTVIPKSVTRIGRCAFEMITIYCEAERKPSDWDSNWNSSTCFVVWGYEPK